MSLCNAEEKDDHEDFGLHKDDEEANHHNDDDGGGSPPRLSDINTMTILVKVARALVAAQDNYGVQGWCCCG